MSKENTTRHQKPWTDEEKHIFKRIVKHAVLDGKAMKEAFEQAAFRFERTLPSVSQYWYTEIGADYTRRIKLRAREEREPLPFEPEEVYEVDTRYNLPRLPPKANDADVEQVIESNPIYKQVRQGMFDAQNRQVAYGLDKYPEPLNADTWTIIETIDHIISETTDKLHYLTMLKIKLQQEMEE